MMERDDLELLAPVGSYDSLVAALQAGANGVYFGVEKLNMRAQSAVNFTLADIARVVDICREKGAKSYLTLNTVMFDHDLMSMREVVDAAKEAGITAVIASDIAVIQYARERGVSVHISTQANVTNLEAVRFFSAYADVIVLARELSLIQVARITRAIEREQIKGPSGKLVRVEIFIHGALCMATSGKCYLSLHEYNYSANRGQCLQVCRRSYILTDKETGAELEVDNEYIMSPKDLCTIEFFNMLLDAGVKVLKIEGRARGPEYVKTVVECYREAIEAYRSGQFSREKALVWKERLATVFNRGFWDGYYMGRRLGEWSEVYGSKATRRKVYIGKGTNYFGQIGVAEFQVETGSIAVGDDILITGPTTGAVELKIKEIRVDLQSVNEAAKGARCSIPVDFQVRRSDKLFKLVAANEKETAEA